jgi:electron transport complex protein RnfB
VLLIAAIAPFIAAGLVAFALGWLLGPALQDRLDEISRNDHLHGRPIRLWSAGVASLPFAVLGDARHGWLFWLIAWIGWLPGLLHTRKGQTVAGDERSLVEAIDRLLPQTQCGQCGFPGCRPYATAIAAGTADINQCPPGGEVGIRALAELLGREPKPLNPANGAEKPAVIALIVEEDCIGCTKCIQACPVDAIIGAPRRMHTVIASLCTGCELCLPPCPVDCIVLVPAPPATDLQARVDGQTGSAQWGAIGKGWG